MSTVKKEGARGGHVIRHTKSGLPVYASEDRQKYDKSIKSASFIGGGIGVGALAGYKGASMVKEAGHLSIMSRAYSDRYKEAVKAGEKLGPLFAQGSKLDYLKKEAKAFAEASVNRKNGGFRLKTGGALLAGTLIGIGINEALKDRPEFKESKKAQAAAVAAPGIIGAVAAGAGFYKKLGGNKVSWTGAAKFALKNLLAFK